MYLLNTYLETVKEGSSRRKSEQKQVLLPVTKVIPSRHAAYPSRPSPGREASAALLRYVRVRPRRHGRRGPGVHALRQELRPPVRGSARGRLLPEAGEPATRNAAGSGRRATTCAQRRLIASTRLSRPSAPVDPSLPLARSGARAGRHGEVHAHRDPAGRVDALLPVPSPRGGRHALQRSAR